MQTAKNLKKMIDKYDFIKSNHVHGKRKSKQL